MDDNSQVELPDSTVPKDTKLAILGLGNDEFWNGSFQRALQTIIVNCGRIMDLRLLDGVTVGFDYRAALDSVALGYESAVAKGYTNSGGLIGVGKAMRVKRPDGTKVHVVLDGNYLGALVDQEHAEFWPTINIVAHELAHVAVTGWFEEHSPGVMLAPQQGDWAIATLRDAAHTIWEEYAACRLSAPFGDNDVVTGRYSSSLALAIDGAFDGARDRIKAFRLHGDTARLLVETATCVAQPLKMGAYLLGHLDGLGQDASLESICPTANSLGFSSLLGRLSVALRSAWDSRLTWSGLEGVDGIVEVIQKALADAGAIVSLQHEAPGSRIDAPYTAETMPNGEWDMLKVRARRGTDQA